MPGQVTWQEQCQNFPVSRQEYYTETETQTVDRTVDDCQPTTTPGRTLFWEQFMCAFLVRKFCAKFFVLTLKIWNFFGARILAQMGSLNICEIDHRPQFWHFMRIFFIRKLYMQLFCTWSLSTFLAQKY